MSETLKCRPESKRSNPLRWLVSSGTRPGVTHLVDLADLDGNGACSCEHFVFHLEPRLRSGKTTTPLRCKHIKVAREALINRTIHLLEEIHR